MTNFIIFLFSKLNILICLVDLTEIITGKKSYYFHLIVKF